MKTTKLILVLIIAGFTANAFAKEPPKPPKAAEDVDCVDAVHIADGEIQSHENS